MKTLDFLFELLSKYEVIHFMNARYVDCIRLKQYSICIKNNADDNKNPHVWVLGNQIAFTAKNSRKQVMSGILPNTISDYTNVA